MHVRFMYNVCMGLTRQAMYVLRNIKARSRNHCCREKAISITYSECVYVALVIRHSKRTRRVILLSVACLALTIFFRHYLINGTIFEKKISYRTQNVCFVFLYKFYLKHHSKNNSAGCYHKCTYVFMYSTRYSCQILMKL